MNERLHGTDRQRWTTIANPYPCSVATDVRTRVKMHVDEATEEAYLHVGHEAFVELDVLQALADARDRGVSLYLEVPSESLRATVRDELAVENVAVSDLSLVSFTTPQ